MRDKVLAEVLGRIGEMIPGAPPTAEPPYGLNSATGNIQAGDVFGGSDHRGGTCPDLGRMFADFHMEVIRYRTVGRQIAPDIQPPQTTSRKGHWSEAAEGGRSERGEVARGDQSHSALQIIDGG